MWVSISKLRISGLLDVVLVPVNFVIDVVMFPVHMFCQKGEIKFDCCKPPIDDEMVHMLLKLMEGHELMVFSKVESHEHFESTEMASSSEHFRHQHQLGLIYLVQQKL